MDSAAEDRFHRWASSRAAQLHRSAYLLCGDWHVAQDLVQDALTQTALHWKRVESANNPDAYVRQILVNQARQRWRRRAGSEPPVEVPAEVAVADGAQDRAVRAELLEAVRRLPHRQRAALVFRYFEQLSEAETAAALGCSIGTVKSQTHRALVALRRIMTAEELPC